MKVVVDIVKYIISGLLFVKYFIEFNELNFFQQIN
jgi:hypothetical protein